MSVQNKAVIFGATGLIGRQLLKRTCASGRYDLVVAIARNPLDANALSSILPDNTARVRLRQISCSPADLADPDVISQILQVTPDGKTVHVYCALGTTMKTAGSKDAFKRVDHDMVVAAANFAGKIPAERFLWVSSIGANSKSRSSFYLKVKGETERDIEALSGRSSMQAIAIRPSLLLGDREDTRLAEGVGQVIGRLVSGLMAGPLKKYRPIAAEDVAELMTNLAFGRDSEADPDYPQFEVFGAD